MKASILSVALFLCGMSLQAAVYLRADSPGGADGQTFDGTSWSTAYKSLGDAYDALQALPATLEDRTLYVAQGVYANVTTDNRIFTCIRICGGYKGETDGDMTRDIDLYQTIFCGKFNKSGVPDAKWRHDEPNLDGFSVKQTTSANLVVTAAGRIELPAFTGEFDGWGAEGSATTETLQIADGEGGVVSGIWFTGFGRNQSRGNCMAVGANVNSVTIEDCVFTANAPQGGCVTITSTTSPSYVRRCRFTRNDVLYSSGTALLSAGQSVEVSDCEFTGNGKSNTYSHSGLMSGAATVKRCVFTHNSYCTTSATISGGSGSSLIGGGTGMWCDCVITNNFCGTICGTAGRFTALLNFSTGSISDSLIANNRCNFKASDGFSYAMIGQEDNFDSYALKQVYSGCLIASNVLSCVEVAATSGSYAIGLLGGHANKNGRPYAPVIVGCTFDGNIVTTVAVDGVAATLSRGILYANTPSAGVTGTSCGFYATNCTFKAEYAEGVYDIAQYGTTSTRKAYITNCIFMQDGADVHQNAILAVSDVFVVKDCTIKNMLSDFYPSDVDMTDGLYYDEIPFERVPFLFNDEETGYGWLRPAARTPGIRETTDGSVRGAVNELSETAEDGVTLTIRRAPFVGGTVDIPVQAVEAGTAIRPVTATPVTGGSFGGWLTEDGRPYEPNPTGNPLTIGSLDADLVLIANFATRKTTITFDLNGAGAFVDNGASQIAYELSAGDSFPELPEYTVGDNNHIYRWDDMPTVVPNEDTTYAAHWVTKDLRIIYVTKEGAGAKDGTSWANAYDDIATAYADAGHYRGEVWIGEGVYTQALPIAKCASVNVRGGFAGDETSAAEADPAAHPTVISGGRSTFYFLTDTDGVAGDVEITGLSFTDFQRSAIDFSTANVGKVTVSKCRFENCNLGGTTSYAAAWVLGEPTFSDCFFSNCVRTVYSKSSVAATTVVERCTFVANRDAGVYAVAANGGRLVVRNCAFSDCDMTTQSDYPSGCGLYAGEKSASAEITDCTFVRNRMKGASGGCVGFSGNGNAGDFIIARCAFRDNVCMHSNWNNTDGYYTSQQFGTCVTLAAPGVTTLLRDCSFVGNVVTNYAGCGASCIVSRNEASKPVAVNCTFEANVAVARENFDRAGTWRSVGNAGTIDASSAGIGLVNCTFVANTNRTDAGGLVAEVFARASTPSCVLNDILWNDDSDYVPFARTDSGKLTVGRTVAKNYDEAIPTSVMGFMKADDPRLLDASEVGPNGVLARELRPATCARGGYSVWTSGAQVFVRNREAESEAEWFNVSTRAFVAADKLPADLSLLPDAWGQPRRRLGAACGALNAPPTGMMLLVR